MKILIDRLHKYLSLVSFALSVENKSAFRCLGQFTSSSTCIFIGTKSIQVLFCCDQISEGLDSRLCFKTKGTKTLGIVSVSLQF